MTRRPAPTAASKRSQHVDALRRRLLGLVPWLTLPQLARAAADEPAPKPPLPEAPVPAPVPDEPASDPKPPEPTAPDPPAPTSPLPDQSSPTQPTPEQPATTQPAPDPSTRDQRPDIGTPYLARAEVRAFIDATVATYDLPRAWVERAIGAARHSPIAMRLAAPAPSTGGTPNWLAYRARAVDAKRLREGTRFAERHAAALARAVEQFGVPAEIIVAIVGIETIYGQVTGRVRTIDALLTLGFDDTRRAAFYREELAQFLILCLEQNLDPLELRGSFAGAYGLGQFMPSSIRRFAIDFDGDGRIDLAASAADAIGSVAHYLWQHGWERDSEIAFAAKIGLRVNPDAGPSTAAQAVTPPPTRGISPDRLWGSLAAASLTIDRDLPADTPVLLIDLPYLGADGERGIQYRVGTQNFSALLHYNRSYFYASAVVELAAALAPSLRGLGLRHPIARAPKVRGPALRNAGFRPTAPASAENTACATDDRTPADCPTTPTGMADAP